MGGGDTTVTPAAGYLPAVVKHIHTSHPPARCEWSGDGGDSRTVCPGAFGNPKTPFTPFPISATESEYRYFYCKSFFKCLRSPNFPLRGKVGQLSKKKRVLCWSIYIIILGEGHVRGEGICASNFSYASQ